MALARSIQTSVLPRTFELPGYDISAIMLPAEEVGGDFYEFRRDRRRRVDRRRRRHRPRRHVGPHHDDGAVDVHDALRAERPLPVAGANSFRC